MNYRKLPYKPRIFNGTEARLYYLGEEENVVRYVFETTEDRVPVIRDKQGIRVRPFYFEETYIYRWGTHKRPVTAALKEVEAFTPGEIVIMHDRYVEKMRELRATDITIHMKELQALYEKRDKLLKKLSLYAV